MPNITAAILDKFYPHIKTAIAAAYATKPLWWRQLLRHDKIAPSDSRI